MKNILKLYFVLALMLFLTSSLEAASGEVGNKSSGVAIGYNPADFTFIINGKPLAGEALTNPVITGLFHSNCSNDSSKSYVITESENPRVVKILMKEINFSNSIYADPTTRLTPNITVATHLVKGDAVMERGRMTVNLRIEDRQGNVKAQATSSGPQKNYSELIDEATSSLGQQMCKSEPKPKPPVKTSCPYLWDVTFEQSGTINSNSCFGSGLSGSDAISTVKGYAYFPKVLIWPSFSYDPTMKEETACDPYEKNDVYHYSAKSQGDTYQLIDDYDGIDADIVSLRASNMNGVERLWIRAYGSVLMSTVQSKISSFKGSHGRSSFMVTDRCGVSFNFSPVPVHGN